MGEMRMKIGVQISSLKPLLTTAQQVEAALARMARMGVDTVQLQWIDPAVSIPEIKEAMRDSGIASVSVQDFSTAILQNPGYYLDLNALTGGTWLCLSRVPERTLAGLERCAQRLEVLRDRAADLDQKLCFHPVAADLLPIDGVCPVDFLMERLKWLDLCWDLYHVHKAGLSIPDTLRRYPHRVCMVHFKDFKVLPDGTELLVPAGQGDIDWTGALEACREIGVPWAFAEQERWDRDPYDCLGEALDWLREAAR